MPAYRRVHDMHVRVSLWAWWEVVAAHHRADDHACCQSPAGSAPLRSNMSMATFTFYLYPTVAQHLFTTINHFNRYALSIRVVVAW